MASDLECSGAQIEPQHSVFIEDLSSNPFVRRLIELGIEEDLGMGDATTSAAVAPDQQCQGRIVAREPLAVSGACVAREVFHRIDPKLDVEISAADGSGLEKGEEILRISGRSASILMGERLALNFLGRLSGIATHTRKFVQAVAGTRARVVDTRKMTPGFRVLEKAAVRHGGGHNHRFNLADGILIKDNHIAAAGGIRQVIDVVRSRARHHLVRLEIEVDTLEQLDEALECGVQVIMLDNMSVPEMNKAVSMTRGRALLEASGGVRLDTIGEIAATGVNLISVGGLVHGARWVDIGLDFD